MGKSEPRIARHRRHARVRAKVKGITSRPRLCVFRSNRHMYAQLIDDVDHKIVVSASDKDVEKKGTKTEVAKMVGGLIAKNAGEKKIKKVVFDRAGYMYHGRVKALAEGAREGGLEF